MSEKTEQGYEERELSKAEWRRIIDAFPERGALPSGTRFTVEQLHRENRLALQVLLGEGFHAHSIQCGVNIKFKALGLPYKLVYRHDGAARHRFGRGRRLSWQEVKNPRFVLVAKKTDDQ